MKNLIIKIILVFLFNINIVYAEQFSDRYPDLVRNGILINKSDYIAQDLKPYYQDSQVFFFEDDNVFFEMKLLPLNVIMIRDMDTKIANFGYGLLHNFPDQSWQVACIKDNITDKVICAIYNNAVNIMHTLNRKMISATRNVDNLDFRKEQLIRVDKNKAIAVKGIFENDKYTNIINQMKKGTDVKSRYYDSDGHENNNEANLQGFKDAYQYMIKLENSLSK